MKWQSEDLNYSLLDFNTKGYYQFRKFNIYMLLITIHVGNWALEAILDTLLIKKEYISILTLKVSCTLNLYGSHKKY
jgi:hypothetical protein